MWGDVRVSNLAPFVAHKIDDALTGFGKTMFSSVLIGFFNPKRCKKIKRPRKNNGQSLKTYFTVSLTMFNVRPFSNGILFL